LPFIFSVLSGLVEIAFKVIPVLAGRPIRRGIRLEFSLEQVSAHEFEDESDGRQYEKVERCHQQNAYHKADGQGSEGQAEIDYSSGPDGYQRNKTYTQSRSGQHQSPNAGNPEHKMQNNPGGTEHYNGYQAELAKLFFFWVPVYLNKGHNARLSY